MLVIFIPHIHVQNLLMYGALRTWQWQKVLLTCCTTPRCQNLAELLPVPKQSIYGRTSTEMMALGYNGSSVSYFFSLGFPLVLVDELPYLGSFIIWQTWVAYVVSCCSTSLHTTTFLIDPPTQTSPFSCHYPLPWNLYLPPFQASSHWGNPLPWPFSPLVAVFTLHVT